MTERPADVLVVHQPVEEGEPRREDAAGAGPRVAGVEGAEETLRCLAQQFRLTATEQVIRLDR